MIRYVTAEELEPHGWCCEACGMAFAPGVAVYGAVLGLTEDGDEIEGDYRCAGCWLADLPVVEAAA